MTDTNPAPDFNDPIFVIPNDLSGLTADELDTSDPDVAPDDDGASDESPLHVHGDDWVGSTLRKRHVKEMFGDCVEDGQRYPCFTIQVLNVAAGARVRAAEAALATTATEGTEPEATQS